MLIEIKRLNKLKDDELRASIEREIAELKKFAKNYSHYTILAIDQFISNYQSTINETLDPDLLPKEKRAIEFRSVQILLIELVGLAKLAELEKTPKLVFGIRALNSVKRSPDNDLQYDTESFKQYILHQSPILKSPSAMVERIQREQRKDVNAEHLDKLDRIEAVIKEYKKSNKKAMKVEFLSKISELKEKLTSNKERVHLRTELSSAIDHLQLCEDNYYKRPFLLFSCFFKNAQENSSLQGLINQISNVRDSIAVKGEIASTPPRKPKNTH
ncbi:MAG: hypothetical protein WAW86_01475 [Gammaproteobacteria bacterium]